jgi:DNA invertase Pin-like site-specific DNA recombinase
LPGPEQIRRARRGGQARRASGKPVPFVEPPQVIHSTKRQNRQKLSKRQSEVHGGYTDTSCPIGGVGSDMLVAISARVSTSSGQLSPEMQLREIRECCRRRRWVVANQYVDDEISGGKEKHLELDRMMADAHRRRFDAVVVWKFDRFARPVSHLLRALEIFKALDIEFVSFSEQLDASTPRGKMSFTVHGAVAELERSLIAERVRPGLRNARAKGKPLGRPRVAVDAVRIATLRAQGRSWREIVAENGNQQGDGPEVALWLAQKLMNYRRSTSRLLG